MIESNLYTKLSDFKSIWRRSGRDLWNAPLLAIRLSETHEFQEFVHSDQPPVHIGQDTDCLGLRCVVVPDELADSET